MQKHPKVVLITGAARRIGAEIARTLHDAGMNIVLHYNKSNTEALALSEGFNAKRAHSAVIFKADLGVVSELTTLIEEGANEWGRLDALVNNASKFYKTKIGEISEASWNDLFDSNLKAPFFLSQAAYPYLKKQKGVIINIADIHGERPMGGYPVYCMTKAGLLMLTKALAKELSPEIRVNAISPGEIAWPEGENSLSLAEKENIIKRIPLRKHGDPKDIAKGVLFFLKDADYVTGQVLAIDGGRSTSM